MFEENIKSIENPIKPEDIFIDDDYIFDSSGEQDIKNISDQIIQDNNIEQNEVLFEDPAPPSPPAPLPPCPFSKIGKKLPRIRPNQRLEMAAKKRKEKYKRQMRNKTTGKQLTKKTLRHLKKAKYYLEYHC